MAAPIEHAKMKYKTAQSMSLNTSKQKDFEREIKNKRKYPKGETKKGTVYLGNIPHGFFEPDMKKFFKQFGNVTRLRLAHSKKTGRSKGYAFIEFEYEAVAKVVAETMNNYLMFEKLLKCQLIPSDKVHPDLFKGSEKHFSKPKAHLVAIKRHNNQVIKDKDGKASRRFTRKNKARMEKLKEMGIDVDFSSVVHDKRKPKIPERTSSKDLSEHSDEKVLKCNEKKHVPITEKQIAGRSKSRLTTNSVTSVKNTEIGKKIPVEFEDSNIPAPKSTEKKQLKRGSKDDKSSDETIIIPGKRRKSITNTSTSETASTSVNKSVKGKNAGPQRLKTLKKSTQKKKITKK